MSIRRRLFAILWTALTLLVVMTGLSFVGAAWSYHGAVVAHESAADRVELARQAQVHFKKQVQEWKNTLLRAGISTSTAEHYWTSFLHEEDQTRSRVRALLDSPDVDATSSTLAQGFLDEHAALGQAYREARGHLMRDPSDPWSVDATVRGRDRPPTDTLDRVVAAVIADRTQTVASREAWAMGILATCLFGLLLSALAIGIVTRSLLHRWVAGPFSEVISLAERLRNGERKVPIPDRGSQDEAGLLLRSLDGLQREVVRREAERQAQMQELRVAHEQALAAVEAKSRFLATMSHELRTPLHGILGALHLLEGADGEERVKLAGLAMHSARALNTLVDDVLTFSRTEHGGLELEPLPTDVQALVRAVADLHRLSARAEGLEIATEWADEGAGEIVVDPTRLRQVVENLVANAIKFTAEGSVRIVGVGRTDELSITVSDTGIGMSAAEMEGIFDVFTQADASTTRRFGGSGMGLAITKNLVQLMDGQISVQSEVGVGSRFEVSLPVGRAAAVPMSRTDRRAPVYPSPEDPPRVLLVEDNPVNRLLAKTMLHRQGAHVDEVENGEEAVRATARIAYDVVLMDIDMPVMDGLTAARTIRRRERDHGDPRTPIVALSAAVLDDERKACFDAGMDHFLAKPIDPLALEELVQRARGAA